MVELGRRKIYITCSTLTCVFANAHVYVVQKHLYIYFDCCFNEENS